MRWQPSAAGNLASSPRIRARGPSGPARIARRRRWPRDSPSTRSSTGPSRLAETAACPAATRPGSAAGRGLRRDPGRRRARRRVRARPVPVAASDRDRRRVPGQPPAQRGRPARVEPAPVPDLDQRRPPLHRRGPADLAAVWVIDRQQAARLLGRVQPGVGRLRKSIQRRSPNALRMPLLGGDLLAGKQRDAVRGRGAAGSSGWWLIVLWSVTARKSRPRPAANRASSGTVSTPSECTVWSAGHRPASAGPAAPGVAAGLAVRQRRQVLAGPVGRLARPGCRRSRP